MVASETTALAGAPSRSVDVVYPFSPVIAMPSTKKR